MRKPWSLAVIVLVSAALAACGSVLPSTGPLPSRHLVVATDADNGQTLDLHVGDQLEVKLNSTYWTFQGSSDAGVLKAAGPAVISPQPSGCVVGAGCGLAMATFDVIGQGSAVVTALRTSCGEAMGCTGSAGSFRVTVVAAS